MLQRIAPQAHHRGVAVIEGGIRLPLRQPVGEVTHAQSGQTAVYGAGVTLPQAQLLSVHQRPDAPVALGIDGAGGDGVHAGLVAVLDALGPADEQADAGQHYQSDRQNDRPPREGFLPGAALHPVIESRHFAVPFPFAFLHRIPHIR